MEPEIRLILWHSEIAGSEDAGVIRAHLFLDARSLEARLEMEHAPALGLPWALLARLA